MSKKILGTLGDLYSNNGIVNLGNNPRYSIKKKTGRPSIDYVTDGGLPLGRLILVAGTKSSGKSSAVIQLSDEVVKKLDSKKTGKILYVDTEYTLTTDYIEKLGCEPSNFDHAMPESTEKMCDLIREKVKDYDVIIIDSINNSASEEQLEKTSEQKTMANRATVLTNQLPIIVGMCNQYETTLIVVSQMRQNMNKKSPYDSDLVIPGGEALHHNSSMTLEFKPSTKKKENAENVFELYETIGGRMINIVCSKNKVGDPFRSVSVEFTYGSGYTVFSDYLSSAIRLGIIEGKGAWYYYKENKFQGLDKLKKALIDDSDLFTEIVKQVNEKLNDVNI
jgi:recombination protein RecA